MLLIGLEGGVPQGCPSLQKPFTKILSWKKSRNKKPTLGDVTKLKNTFIIVIFGSFEMNMHI